MLTREICNLKKTVNELSSYLGEDKLEDFRRKRKEEAMLKKADYLNEDYDEDPYNEDYDPDYLRKKDYQEFLMRQKFPRNSKTNYSL